MHQIFRSLTALMLLVLLLAPAWANLDGTTPYWEYEGMVTGVNTNYFTMIGNDQMIIRVMVAPGQRLHRDVIPGIRVKVILQKGNHPEEWWLDHFRYIEPPLGAPPAPEEE